MRVTGFKSRSIADQTGVVSYQFGVSPTYVDSVFGLSGNSVLSFTVRNGKLYDFGGRFVSSVSPLESLSVSGRVSASNVDYYINGSLAALGVPFSGSKFSSIFVNSSVGVEFSAVIEGESPDYTIQNVGSYTPSGYISGTIVNNIPSRAFRIFDASINGASSYEISSFTTGNITGTGYVVFYSDSVGLQDSVIPVNLVTNFGPLSVDFTMSGDNTVLSDIYLNLSPDSTNVVNNTVKYINGVFSAYPSGSRVGVSLEYVSGTTGNIYYFIDATNSASEALSGYITGQAALSRTTTGIVSGLDPKTLINETGVGTGVLSTSLLTATGFVSGDLSVNIYGLGDASLPFDYTASGVAVGGYTGRVPLTGASFNIYGYNFLATGSYPAIDTGIVGTGMGKFHIYPSGCMPISQTITASDYTVANLSVEKTYTGPISYNYSVVGAGYATGRNVSGQVTSMFLPQFEPGYYVFTKGFSGIVSGNYLDTGHFNPKECNFTAYQSGVTGTITGTFTLGNNASPYYMDCEVYSDGMPSLYISGYPSSARNSSGQLVNPSIVGALEPTGGYGTETSSSHVRVRSSREGATPSGSGRFLDPVTSCLSSDNMSVADLEEHVWAEQVTTSGYTTGFDSTTNSLGFISADIYLTGVGDFQADYTAVEDSGILNFSISGTGGKAIAIRGLNLGETDRILQINLYKNGLLMDAWEDIYIQASANAYLSAAQAGTTAYDGLVLSDLTSGNYTVLVAAKTAARPTISFTASEYTGCESAGFINVTVKAQGYFRQGCCVQISDYTDGTARSGVHYNPVYLYYNQGLTGCVGVETETRVCEGICFAASAPNGSGQWEYETHVATFSVPIYDNAVYGDSANFYVGMNSDSISGATLGSPSLTTVTILDDDNLAFVIESGGNTGVLTPPTLDCTPIVPEIPAVPTYCELYPYLCDPCYLYPQSCSGLPACTECEQQAVTCKTCNPANLTGITGLCRGVFHSGTFGIPGLSCDAALTMTGCGATDGYVYVGRTACANASFSARFAGNCLGYSYALYPENCPTPTVPCATAACPTGDIEFSGCSQDLIAAPGDRIITCSGNSGQSYEFPDPDGDGNSNCYNFANPVRKKPTCEALLLFLKVYVEDCHGHPSAHGCNNWGFTGQCVFPAGNPLRQLCDQ